MYQNPGSGETKHGIVGMAIVKKTGTDTEHRKVVSEESQMTIMSVDVFHIRQTSLQSFS